VLQIIKFQAAEGEKYESVRPQGFKLRGEEFKRYSSPVFRGKLRG
jgi:hypothetical protein